MFSTRGHVEEGVIMLVTGVLGYVILGVFLAAVIAMIAAAFPKIRLLPTTVLGGVLRTITVGLILGLATAPANPLWSTPSAASDAKTSAPPVGASESRSECLSAYDTDRYKESMPACKRFALDYVGNLQKMAHSRDYREIRDRSWDMFRATYVMAFGYRSNKQPVLARQAALHSVGWAIYCAGALDELDPKNADSSATRMTESIAQHLRTLESTFPGVVSEERKAVEEASHAK
jgi:hypothetical protein